MTFANFCGIIGTIWAKLNNFVFSIMTSLTKIVTSSLFALLVASSLVQTAKADLLPDNTHRVDSCLRIDNYSSFSDYEFYISGSAYRWDYTYAEKITGGTICGATGATSLIAVPKENVVKLQPGDRSGIAEEVRADANVSFTTNPANKDLYFSSNLDLDFPDTLPDTDSAVKVTQVVKIESIEIDPFVTTLIKTDYTDKNGVVTTVAAPSNLVIETIGANSVNTNTIADRNTNPSDSSPSTSLPIYSAVLMVIGLVGLFAAYKAWNK